MNLFIDLHSMQMAEMQLPHFVAACSCTVCVYSGFGGHVNDMVQLYTAYMTSTLALVGHVKWYGSVVQHTWLAHWLWSVMCMLWFSCTGYVTGGRTLLVVVHYTALHMYVHTYCTVQSMHVHRCTYKLYIHTLCNSLIYAIQPHVIVSSHPLKLARLLKRVRHVHLDY